jgi:hypothetical protein
MAAKGFKERILIPALRKQGLSVRGARAVIGAVLGSINDALHLHEPVDSPIGNFTVVENPKKRRSWRFGKVTTLYAHRYRVDFLASPELNLAAAAAASTAAPRAKRKKLKKKQVGSELDISTELIVEFIRNYIEADSWILFFYYLRDNPSNSEMFKKVKPKSGERRPLDEADQVIEECAPARMPQKPRKRLEVCLRWFARWTQRVMPNPLWQEAMHAAKEILAPEKPMQTLDGR